MDSKDKKRQKINKVISLKLLPSKVLPFVVEQEHPEFPFTVKAIVEGQKIVFQGAMKVVDDKKAEFIFDDLGICLDNWFAQCQESLKTQLFNQLQKYKDKI